MTAVAGSGAAIVGLTGAISTGGIGIASVAIPLALITGIDYLLFKSESISFL